MNSIQGAYIGEQVLLSTFKDGMFIDEETDISLLNSSMADYVTSERQTVEGESEKSIALAYYAFFMMKKGRSDQCRVYEILCAEEDVEIFVYEGFGQANIVELLHQNEKLSKSDSEKLLATKKIVELLCMKYPENEKILYISNLIERYEYEEINEKEPESSNEVENIISRIMKQIVFENDVCNIELAGATLVLTSSFYEKDILERNIDSYLVLIQKFINRINNNFAVNDIVYIYADKLSKTAYFKDKLNSFAKKNSIAIDILESTNRCIARGNAYSCYLKKYLYYSIIRENIGRYSILLEEKQINLDAENGELLLGFKDDFVDYYLVNVYDSVLGQSYEIEFLVPFSFCNSIIEFTYRYEPEGMWVEIKDTLSKEENKKMLYYMN